MAGTTRVLRRRLDNVMHLVAFGLLALLFAFGRGDAAGVVVGIALAVIAVRGFRNGVYVRADDVVVRETFRSRRVSRDSIARVDIDPSASWFGAAIALVLHDGAKVPLWSLQPGRKKGEKLHRALVAVLADVQQALAQ